jgi:AAA15 family ATPase/GTPase
MIHSVDIMNFRCFKHLFTERCPRFNVIVGDNGAGKTSLLEAIFFALGSSPDMAIRYRAQRGLGSLFNASPFRIEDAIWRDLFYKRQWDQPISIRLRADGADNRSLTISRGDQAELPIPMLDIERATATHRSASIIFEWTNAAGQKHQSRPRFTPQGFVSDSPEEDLPDFFYFAANQTIGAEENAQRFSELGFEGKRTDFIKFFTTEYPWLSDLSIEVVAGSPTIYGTLRNGNDRFPLAMVSGGINRILSITLALASHPKSVILVDEIENGIYFKHHQAVWRGLSSLARRSESQLFVTTHNEEWLEAIFDEAVNVGDVALWRLEITDDGPALRQFTGKQIAIAVQTSGEVR